MKQVRITVRESIEKKIDTLSSSRCLSKTSLLSAAVCKAIKLFKEGQTNIIQESLNNLSSIEVTGKESILFFRIPDEFYDDFDEICKDAGISNILDGFRILVSDVEIVFNRQVSAEPVLV